MHKRIIRQALVVVSGLALLGAVVQAEDKKDALAGWKNDFTSEKSDLGSSGRNPFFVLEPGYGQILENGDERLVIVVSDQTKKVDGVECRIIEERETKAGKLVEITNNYYAIGKKSNTVFYFGEDVDIYKDGKVASHDGAWLSGVSGARFGMIMPGQVALKDRFYQEVAPKIAMDRCEIVSTSETVKTPAGEFKNCVKIEETTPLEPKTKEYKFYANGVGLVQDGEYKLVKYGKGVK